MTTDDREIKFVELKELQPYHWTRAAERNMIIFDMEWNHGCDDIPLDEILQIGAVRLDRLGGTITGVFDVSIRPAVHPKLGVMAREVLDLEQFTDSQWDFSTAIAAFWDWCGEDRVFGTWGNSDVEVLRRNCAYWKLPEPELGEVYDIQESFSALLGTAQRIALYRAVEYCQIPDCLDCHNALSDAVYTAMVGEWIPTESLCLCAKPRRIQRLSDGVYAVQRRRRVGPFPSLEILLNARDTRKAFCPQCGKRISISAWYSTQPYLYYADFCCPEHGWFIYRLTAACKDNGTWRGRSSVPVLTEKLKREFYLATKGNRYVCQTRTLRRKHRRTRQNRQG